MTTINVPLDMAGRYQLEIGKLDADGNEVPGSRRVAVPWFDNLITDGGLDQLGNVAYTTDLIDYCRIGTGNTTPANTDTGLVAQVGATNTAGIGALGSGLSVDGTYIYRSVSKRFLPGAVSGVNLAELAMASATTGQVFSRSLIKDTGGTPTTITLAADEYLDVIYELRLYLPANDQTASATIDGAANTVTIRYATKVQQLNNWAAALGYPFDHRGTGGTAPYTLYDGVESLPESASGWYATSAHADGATVTIGSYTTGTHSKSLTLAFGPTVANFPTGIGCVLLGTSDGSNKPASLGPWAFGFSPKLNKTSTRKATVTVSFTWGRL